MKRTFDVSTKQDKDSDAKRTVLTVNYPEGVPTWLLDGYDAFLTVKLQGAWRKNGIPATLEVNAQDYAPGTRRAPQTLEQSIASLSDAERAALIAKLQASLK